MHVFGCLMHVFRREDDIGSHIHLSIVRLARVLISLRMASHTQLGLISYNVIKPMS
jgi:hypothetical protein